jgi:hypothetical protein
MRAARRVKTLSEETRQNCTDALQWPERRRDARRFRSHKLLDPIRDGASKLLNLVLVLHEPGIVRHATPPCCGHMQFVGICNLWAYAIENFDSNQDRSRAAVGAPRRRNGPTFFVCRQASSLLLTITASATEISCSRDVRFPPESDHIADVSDWQLCARSGSPVLLTK